MSLVAHWRLDGDVTDSVGNNDGSGSPTYVDGKLGKAVRGDGTTIDVSGDGIDSALSGNQMTLSLWWKQTDTGNYTDVIESSPNFRLERGSDSHPSQSDYWCNWGAGDSDWRNAGINLSNSDIGIPQGEWFHIVVRRKGSDLEIWINGELDNSATTDIPMTTYGDSFTINPANSNSDFDDIRLYDHAISEKKITQLSQAKVLHYKMNDDSAVTDASGQGNDGTLNGPSFIEDSAIGSGAYSFDSSDSITASGVPIDNTGLTISVWIRPDSTTGYAGIIASNDISTAFNQWLLRRGDDGNYQLYLDWNGSGIKLTIPSTDITEDGTNWYHLSATFDGGTAKLYLDGVEKDSQSNSSQFSSTSVTIGEYDDGSFQFNGDIADVRLYKESLSASEIQQLYEQRASIDAGGNVHAHEYIETKYDGLTADYTNWEVGTSGSQGSFLQNGNTGENEIVTYTDPFGKDVPTWKCIPDSTNQPDGGWDMTFSNHDSTQRLRMSVFVKRTGTGGETYHGCDKDGNTLNLDGTGNGNPYFWLGNLPSTNEWYLVVGLLHPNSYTGSDTGVSGVYDMDGNKVYNGSEYKWDSGSNRQELRDYLYYSTTTSERQYLVYPRVDVVDGTEPSISSLVNGLDSRIHDHVQNIDTTEGQPLSVRKDSTFVSGVSEVGPAPESLVGWWPLNGHTKDYAGVNNGTNYGATKTSGLGQSAYDFDASSTRIEANLDGLTEPFSAFVWIKPDTSLWNSPSRRGFVEADVFELDQKRNENCSFILDGIASVGDVNDNTYQYPTDQWTLAGIWYDGSTLKMYRNTDVIDQTNASGSLSGQDSIMFGRNVYHTDRNWGGKLQDVRIYDRALSAEEVAQLYALTDPREDQRVMQSGDGTVFAKNQFTENL